MTPVQDAIERSISHSEIVTLDPSGSAENILTEVCENSADCGEVIEFWGCGQFSNGNYTQTDDERFQWRVHVRRDVFCSTDDVAAREFTPALPLELTVNNHRWRWTLLSNNRGSLICLDPEYSTGIDSYGEEYEDRSADATQWPTDEELSVLVGAPVRFIGAGDSNVGPEGIFEVGKAS